MADSLAQPRLTALLNSVPKADPAKAKRDANAVHTCSRLLRQAIANTGMSHDEAMDALGVKHKGQFSEMLDGIRKLWTHQLLRPEAAAILTELFILIAVAEGTCTVERVVRFREAV